MPQNDVLSQADDYAKVWYTDEKGGVHWLLDTEGVVLSAPGAMARLGLEELGLWTTLRADVTLLASVTIHVGVSSSSSQRLG